MVKKKTFDDPLDGIDPVMEGVFTPEPDPAQTRAFRILDEHRQSIADVEFPSLTPESSGKKLELDMFSKIPINVSVELGRAQVSLKEVFELTEGSIIELERLVGEPLDLVVNGQVVAQGEVVAIDTNYGLRVTHVIALPHS
jgi:flagellar motor switch protein FliN/FliY